MSHSSKDAVGGHHMGFVFDDGFYSHSAIQRRWSKKRNRREARREARAIVAECLRALEDERQEALEMHEANEAFYEMFYEEDDWLSNYDDEQYRREQAQAEADEYDMLYGSYYDDYAHDDLETDWFGARSREHDIFAKEPVEVISSSNPSFDPFADSGESLGDILARMMVEGAR